MTKIETMLPEDIDIFLEKNLLQVQKPGRYIGGELNQIKKEWHDQIKVALAFPDVYDIGLPNLGILILYEIINKREDALAERVYAPWLDMEELLRNKQVPLYTLESKHALSQFDILAFTLPYESIYTNVLNIMDLAHIPMHTAQRTGNDPLIIAGGHAAYNPEPMAEFIDAFILGDGEYVIDKVIDAVKIAKEMNIERGDLLITLAQIPGVYVPSQYEAKYNQVGYFESLTPLRHDIPSIINKHISPDLPIAPTCPLVPNIDVVHNRIAVEIMRGCTRGCRFCHAGFVNRPVRERSIDEILAIIEKSLENTGYEEISLLSLSSSDYSQIGELVDRIKLKFEGKNLTISLPSLRIESFSIELMEKLRTSRPGGFTLAPEAATDHIRRTINKPIEEESLLAAVRDIYSRGWQTIKLYFMIGHPSETDEDVIAIAELCNRVLAEGRKLIGNRANLNVGIASFVPKPHTPFQWVAMDTVETMKHKQDIFRKHIKSKAIKYSLSKPDETIFEAMLTRGDRRMGQAILNAWQHGAKFDAWREQFLKQVWQEAFDACGLNPDSFVHREFDISEVLPWDHIHPGVNRSFLEAEYLRSKDGILREDCRTNCFACGILPNYRDLRIEHPGDQWKCPEIIVN